MMGFTVKRSRCVQIFLETLPDACLMLAPREWQGFKKKVNNTRKDGPQTGRELGDREQAYTW